MGNNRKVASDCDRFLHEYKEPEEAAEYVDLFLEKEWGGKSRL